ncbi:hypothetical protein CHS0354_007999 [Potamilus streckersoni]|uniref:Uncharacterized protein n=1 Tax=Potamilus streckersoni TaxID=2493646 RepID=A0AAE0VU35_9BIVA|nr:hypothetical protein CHS0354_007999 [Potamilus streckersoni]
MNHRSVTATLILVITTVTMGQDNYQSQRVLPQHPVPSPNIDIHGSPLGIWKPGGDLPLHGGTRKSDPFDPLLSNPLGSLDLSALGSRETRLRQWLADNSLSFDSLRAEFHPDPHHAGAHIKPPVHPSKPNVHGTIDPAFPHGKTPVIDPWLNGGSVGAKVSGGLLPAQSDLLSGFNSGGFVGVNRDPRLHQGLVDKIPGVGQVFDTIGHTGSHPKPVIKGPIVKDAFSGKSHDVLDPFLGAGHGGGKIDNLVLSGGSVGGLVNDPRRKPAGGFPTGY